MAQPCHAVGIVTPTFGVQVRIMRSADPILSCRPAVYVPAYASVHAVHTRTFPTANVGRSYHCGHFAEAVDRLSTPQRCPF